ncbi:Na+/H+ antiporter NhaC family protein [uncultured Megasphaera sp.]|uniref:Na+/H+ antiporter NhaC family protein n=1 Tax=uncultured Megasphaera sp. TaxID=165188 RepID=UPI0025F8B48C|nr:Na+/H+ antiporter NhaC family protein [uncultured Megasphaera sp.]
MNFLPLGLFAAGLLFCLVCHLSVLYALAFGYVVFFTYGRYCRLSVRELLSLSWQGIRTIRMVLIVFGLIGLITATWRASGTIPFLVYEAGQIISPHAFLLLTFLLNAMLSVLIGTSFGTVATMGVICMSIGNVMGCSPVLLSGAVLSGIYVGDRCSPLSTSALVVAAITKTDLFANLRRMAVRAAVPVLLSCLFYGAAGFYTASGAVNLSVLDRFQEDFVFTWTVLLPAVVVIVMSLLRIAVWKTMLVSIAAALGLCLFLQDMDWRTLLPMLLTGYETADPALSKMLNGGGLLSMAQPAVLVALSCSYAGIFAKTDLLDGIKGGIRRLARMITAFGCTIVVSLASVAIACNQTLSSIMVQELCQSLYDDKEEMALALEDTTIVLAALVPWSVAAAVPLAALGASSWGIAAAVYLYLQPLWSWLRTSFRKREQGA